MLIPPSPQACSCHVPALPTSISLSSDEHVRPSSCSCLLFNHPSFAYHVDAGTCNPYKASINMQGINTVLQGVSVNTYLHSPLLHRGSHSLGLCAQGRPPPLPPHPTGKTRVAHIQRSCGYALRNTLSIAEIKRAIDIIRAQVRGARIQCPLR